MEFATDFRDFFTRAEKIIFSLQTVDIKRFISIISIETFCGAVYMQKQRVQKEECGVFGYGMRRFWKRHIPCAVFCQIIGFLAIGMELLLPLLSALFVDYVLEDGTSAGSGGIFSFLVGGRFGEPQTWRLFFSVAAVFAVFVVLREILMYVRNVLFQYNGLCMENELRDATYKKLVELDSRTVADYNTGELLTTLSSDIISFKELYSRTLLTLGDSFFVLIVSCVILALNSAWMLLLPAVIAPALLAALVRYMRAARRVSQRIRTCNAAMNLTVQENINAVRLIRSFSNEAYEENKFDAVNAELRGAYCEQVNISSRYGLLFNVIRQAAYIATVALGTLLVLAGEFAIGIMTAAVTYVLKVMDHLTQIGNSMYQLQFYLVSGGRIRSFLERKSRIQEPECPVRGIASPDIVLKDVSVTEDGKALLKHIDLQVPYGKKVGVMGGTGSGKSVLLKSLVRIYDATEGCIELGGKDIRSYSLEELRSEFSYVFQDVFLFSNTINANISFAVPKVRSEAVRKAAGAAQASAFIETLPDGYDTIVGERGFGLSGGQKQRVSIARALVKDSPVLIFDDATSALDVDTERKLMQNIRENYPERTVFIAAHRVSAVEDCDEILYLQDGEIIERGTFAELIERGGVFAQIWKLQTASAELEEETEETEVCR